MRKEKLSINRENQSFYFEVLKALTIMLVVSGHVGGVFNIIGLPISKNEYLFPAYSFHMPMFIFISGYFYKLNNEKNILGLLRKRFNSLVIPYYKTNLVYGILVTWLITSGLFSKGRTISVHNLIIEPWVSGYQFNLNGPGWFVLFLFLLQLLYTAIRLVLSKLFERRAQVIDIVLVIAFILIGWISTYCSIGLELKKNPSLWIVLRTVFGLQFYHMGYLYKRCLINKIPLNLKSFIVLLLAKYLFINVAGNYTFSMRALMFKESVYLPVIVSVFGIYYLLHVAGFIMSLLENKDSGVKNILSYIGKNTWLIMMHHMLMNFIFLPMKGKYELFDYWVYPVILLSLSLIIDKKFIYGLEEMRFRKKQNALGAT